MALGGSTNSTLHLLAIAHAANVELTLDDFNTFQEKVPHLADFETFWSICIPRPLQGRRGTSSYEISP